MSEELDEAIREHLELRVRERRDTVAAARLEEQGDEWDFPSRPATAAARSRPRDGVPVDWAELDGAPVVEEPAPRRRLADDDDIFSSIPLEERRAPRAPPREEGRPAPPARRLVAPGGAPAPPTPRPGLP